MEPLWRNYRRGFAMIVRRVSTAQPPFAPYLVDERLDVDEIGALTYLNSIDDGTEINVLSIGRRLHCGQFRFGRILRSLRALGYIKTEKKHRRGRGNGRGAIPADFLVRDEAPIGSVQNIACALVQVVRRDG